jgi:peptidoglycan/xylan/chitin deacetylase (PgdA/CDA1 family)
MWDLSWHTPALLAERGFLYDSSLMDADAPYELRVDERRSLVEIPIQWSLDDWEQFCYLPDISGSGLIETPAKARELWQAEFDALHEVGGCWVMTNHPFLTGRPSRARELGRLMEHVTSHDDVWVAALGDIAAHVRGLGLTPRSIVRPQP